MKIIFIITDIGSYYNFLEELSNELSRNWELHVITSSENVINVGKSNLISEENIVFHEAPIPRRFNPFKCLKAAIKIRSIIKNIRPELVHIHFTTAIFPSIIFKVKHIKYWGTFHGLGINSSLGVRKLLFSLVESLSFWRLNKIIVLNDIDYDFLKNKYGNKVLKHQCYGVGCNLEKFNPALYDKNTSAKIKSELNIDTDCKVLTFTGRFVEFKGFHFVLKSIIELEKLYPERFKVMLIGGFDPSHADGLNDQEREFFLHSKSVINVGFTNNVARYLSISDLFIFPSIKEGLPTCVMEALAMGVPVITLNTRGNSDLIKNNYNGILLDYHTNQQILVSTIVDNIIGLFQNNELYNLCKHHALNDRAKYSRTNFINESIHLYNKRK